tara:strand:+ start:434 stop:934 length:501 start_codon:yes stop_codon:yes gene_type:complete
MHIIVNKNYLNYLNYKVKCALGKRGIGKKKKEGDLITPKGVYKIKYLLYRKDRIKKIKTTLKKVILKKNMGWCNDTKTSKYNKIIELPFNYSHEKLYKRNNIYDIILVLDYNMNPIKKNKGSAIFIHVAKKKLDKTEGCIAVKKRELITIIKRIKKNTKVKIVSQI